MVEMASLVLMVLFFLRISSVLVHSGSSQENNCNIQFSATDVVHCTGLRGVAARAGSVHLISSMDRKPSRKGGARPRPKQPHPVPQGPPFSIKCLLRP